MHKLLHEDTLTNIWVDFFFKAFNKSLLFTLGLKKFDTFLMVLSQLISVQEANRNIIRNLFL